MSKNLLIRIFRLHVYMFCLIFHYRKVILLKQYFISSRNLPERRVSLSIKTKTKNHSIFIKTHRQHSKNIGQAYEN